MTDERRRLHESINFWGAQMAEFLTDPENRQLLTWLVLGFLAAALLTFTIVLGFSLTMNWIIDTWTT